MNPKLLKIILLMEEKELIQKAQSGDRQSLAELVKKYEQTIYNFAFSSDGVTLASNGWDGTCSQITKMVAPASLSA